MFHNTIYCYILLKRFIVRHTITAWNLRNVISGSGKIYGEFRFIFEKL